jgi:hypothetical protein
MDGMDDPALEDRYKNQLNFNHNIYNGSQLARSVAQRVVQNLSENRESISPGSSLDHAIVEKRALQGNSTIPLNHSHILSPIGEQPESNLEHSQPIWNKNKTSGVSLAMSIAQRVMSDRNKSPKDTVPINPVSRPDTEFSETIPSIQMQNLNVDPNPVITVKKTEPVELVRNVIVKYKQPPALPQHGDVVIHQEPDIQIPPEPPLVIVQKPKPPPIENKPILIRDPLPPLPMTLPEEHLTLPGKYLAPPPRKVILERLPEIPPKPQDIVHEKWLPYEKQQRNVRYVPAPPVIPALPQKNELIQWEKPEVIVKTNIKVIRPETEHMDHLIKSPNIQPIHPPHFPPEPVHGAKYKGSHDNINGTNHININNQHHYQAPGQFEYDGINMLNRHINYFPVPITNNEYYDYPHHHGPTQSYLRSDQNLITEDEFLLGAREMGWGHYGMDSVAKSAFRYLDRNRSGYLNTPDVRHAYGNLYRLYS